ncbi:MAG: tRNA uridine-5-carboxymethylaminomethyl(34) synthesis GTPase MnmE [Lachnospiraceae bacterium]|nr:tRNA uridine-5-carboxymethylaminomethyl(34) synthesis GTPase MnmE [Lachnospiraceae bacterium]
MITDTIAAISTSTMSNAGIGIVRISGDEAISIADKIFVSNTPNKTLKNVKSHTINYGKIVENGKYIDEVLVSVMKAPNTYTKEDIVEINCHGGILVVQKILSLVIESGARIAEPGEFTKRAFLNGRMDLSQAEAVMELIHSKNEFALKSSMSSLRGDFSSKINEIREQVINNIAYIEAALDDPEHISLEGFLEELDENVDKYIQTVEKLLATADNGRILKEGINTVILGKPNAGKSSLLNALSGVERAIVTDIEGTTRDTLEEQINLDGIVLNLIDTAGIRETQDIVEKIGVQKAKDYAQTADLIIYVVDASTKLDDNDLEIIDIIKDKKTIVLLNKSDLEAKITMEDIKEHINCKTVSISAKNLEGIDDLSDTIKKMFLKGEVSFDDEIYVANVRQKTSLQEALKSFKMVKTSIENCMPEDFLSIDLMNAYAELGKIVGQSVEEDLVNEIFSKFCMGK